MRVLEACGVEVVVPQRPALLRAARRSTRATWDRPEHGPRRRSPSWSGRGADYIVTAGGHCAVAMLHDYVPSVRRRAGLAGAGRRRSPTRVIDFTTFMDRVAQLRAGRAGPPDAPSEPGDLS